MTRPPAVAQPEAETTNPALELATRRRIFRHVQSNPGAYLRELQRDLAMAMGALEYHLDELVRSGLLTVRQDAHKRFFPAAMDRNDKPALAFLRQALPRRVVLELLAKGQRSKAQLSEAVQAAPSTLNYHLGRLGAVGLVQAGRDGREAVYELVDAARLQRLLVAYRESFMDRFVDAYLAATDAMRPQA